MENKLLFFSYIIVTENETDTKKELKNPEILILYKRCQI